MGGKGRFLIKFLKIKLLHFNTYKPYYSDIHCMFVERKLFYRKKHVFYKILKHIICLLNFINIFLKMCIFDIFQVLDHTFVI